MSADEMKRVKSKANSKPGSKQGSRRGSLLPGGEEKTSKRAGRLSVLPSESLM